MFQQVSRVDNAYVKQHGDVSVAFAKRQWVSNVHTTSKELYVNILLTIFKHIITILCYSLTISQFQNYPKLTYAKTKHVYPRGQRSSKYLFRSYIGFGGRMYFCQCDELDTSDFANSWSLLPKNMYLFDRPHVQSCGNKSLRAANNFQVSPRNPKREYSKKRQTELYHLNLLLLSGKLFQTHPLVEITAAAHHISVHWRLPTLQRAEQA